MSNSTDSNGDPYARHRVIHMGHPDPHVPGFEIPEGVAAKPSPVGLIVTLILLVVAAFTAQTFGHLAHGSADAVVHPLWILPFAILLCAIATMPFINRHWWEHNYGRFAIALGVIVGAYYAFFLSGGRGNLYHALEDYISFMFLLGSLFVVSGGILIRVRTRATPLANVALLAVGAVIANLLGTTGASMLLIRPFIRLNNGRLKPFHVVFFIFIVANCGGSLTPIGDPPLFLGYLKGVPFFWTITHCWQIWLMVNGILLAVFFLLDTFVAAKSPKDQPGDFVSRRREGPALSFYGSSNIIGVVLIIAGVLLHKPINEFTQRSFGFEGPWRELLMALAIVISLAVTPRRVHIENRFNFAPIKEVAFLFIGIFLTMMPALNYLYHNAKGGFPNTPGQYYFTVGALSSVLDNAPTYLTFFKTKLGSLDSDVIDRASIIIHRDDHTIMAADLVGLSTEQQSQLVSTVEGLTRYHKAEMNEQTPDELIRVGALIADPELSQFLIAISMGAVLFGACTYIGNGPNFMVKSIAENAEVPVPSFFGYILYYALPVLIPTYTLVWFIFLRT